MKNIRIVLLVLLMVMTGCAPSFEKQEEVIEENIDETGQETAIIPSYNISDENYRVLLDYKLSKSRGVIVNQVANRLDIDELEEGLRRQSLSYYDPDRYFFQEGQYITEDVLYSWLERNEGKDEEDEEDEEEDLGLNPEIPDLPEDADTEERIEAQRENPKYLSHILEQNYLTKTEDDVVQLGGISIGIAMKSVYRYQTEIGGPNYYKEISMEDMLAEGKDISQQVLDRIRQMEGLTDVPVMIALYREQAHDSLVPGNFVARTGIDAGSSSIGDWETIDEEYMLFPSNEAKEKYPDTWANIEDFESDIGEYFPNYVSVIGKGFYRDQQLQKLTLEIPISFNGKAEVIGFTQYVYGLVREGFQKHYDLEINITSSDNQESLIIREAGEDEPYVHVYH
ncbi:CamS family sex pheromone protein [Aquibacillus koreensis]|uniref:CamS family sex pheromone protein n=1 Tax=Aquibacillus koreensis TaxID=279446 RepID=A0A9X3WQC0_9BACI|nr:CamS family sex pheromone protein [Aquibacillus koreensis]MCT2536814.1 CamS family sex pheromone protein [Aquibacillus koreensis]MDC3421429.1 CamS family sex pheromone protein [Aquibacillus koreensis]